MHAVVLAIHGLVNTISTKLLAWISTLSAAWHFLGSLVLAVLIPCVAPSHQSASFVFLEFQGADVTGSALLMPPLSLVDSPFPSGMLFCGGGLEGRSVLAAIWPDHECLHPLA